VAAGGKRSGPPNQQIPVDQVVVELVCVERARREFFHCWVIVVARRLVVEHGSGSADSVRRVRAAAWRRWAASCWVVDTGG